jgi:SAM-dependent methyltransferase
VSSDTATTAATWPFWAPSEAEAVAAALDLAGVGPGVRFMDLGCGDGQVMLAAAERGATVAGVEADPELVAEAEAHLADAGVEATVTSGDLLDPDLALDAGVFFTYLAPATLQRLRPALARRGGARLVTVDFAVPGLTPDRRSGAARLYRLPGRRRPAGAPGWPTAGTLVSTVPDCQSLSCLELVHPGGPISARLGGALPEVASVLAGADHLDDPGDLAIDVRWEPMGAGTVVHGTVAVTGADDHALFVIAAGSEDEGVWELGPGAVRSLRAALGGGQPPATLAELLDATAT